MGFPHSAVIFYINRSLIYFRQCVLFRTVVNSTKKIVTDLNPNRSLETELALFLMTAIRKMWLYIVGS